MSDLDFLAIATIVKADEEKIRADERAKVVDEAIKILKENALISAMGKIEKLKEQANG